MFNKLLGVLPGMQCKCEPPYIYGVLIRASLPWTKLTWNFDKLLGVVPGMQYVFGIEGNDGDNGALIGWRPVL